MPELKERFRELDQLRAPELRQLIRVRVERLPQPDALVSVADQAWLRFRRRRVTTLITQVLAGAAIVALSVGLALIFHLARTVAPVRHAQPPPFRIERPGMGVCKSTCSLGNALFVSARVGWLAESLTPDPASPACNPACPTTSVVFRTDDGGSHWTAQLTIDGWLPTILATSDGREVLAVPRTTDGTRLFHSTDGGGHWTSLQLPAGTGQAVETTCKGGHCSQGKITGQVDFLNPREGWVLSQEASFSTVDILHTSDSGAHWSLTRIDAQAAFSLDLAKGLAYPNDVVDHALPAHLVFGDSSTGWLLPSSGRDLYTTHDGGRTWRKTVVQAPGGIRHDAVVSFDSVRLFSNHKDGVLSMLVETQGNSNQEQNLLQYVYTTSDTGYHWSTPTRLPRIAAVQNRPSLDYSPIDFVDASHWVAWPEDQMTGAPAGLLRTSDVGRHWDILPGSSVPSYNGWFGFLDPARGWAYVTDSSGFYLYQTTDGGASWIQLSLPELPK